MEDLANKKCVPCEGGIPAFDIKEVHKYLKKIDGWDVLKDKEKNYYIRLWQFFRISVDKLLLG